MILTYHGHSAFKLKGNRGTVVTDPYDDSIGFSMPRFSADVVTVSHQHPDHNSMDKITGTARRSKPFLVDQPGEYEVGRISVFGLPSFHDDVAGADRGTNTIFTILIDDMKVCHLGDLGHELTADQLEALGDIDILLCPVGGFYTIGPEQAVKVVRAIEPSIVIPMHYRTPGHDAKMFEGVNSLDDFLNEYGMGPTPVDKLDISSSQLPEETELIVLSQTQ
jgi:L-ascorbate metabolism protein UlaG (beta-lactamase superfamily)